ncbi:MAG TPA: riboflavin kinase [bacterium]|nr:riboflavin kinase [bacterium]
MILLIGVFEGLHLGHRKLVSYALKKRKGREKIVVLSFYPHPRKPSPYLYPWEERVNLLRKWGVDEVLRFDLVRHFTWRAGAFLDFIENEFHPRILCVGEDFRFGRGREAGAAFIKFWGARKNIRISVLPVEKRNGEKISTALLKRYLSSGRMSLYLNRSGMGYIVRGKRVKGRGLGKKSLVPTVNLRVPGEKFLPRGVFLAKSVSDDGVNRWGVANIGYAPTLKNLRNKIVEFHLLSGDLPFRREVEIELVSFLRRERKFRDISALKRAIGEDILTARRLIRNKGLLP